MAIESRVEKFPQEVQETLRFAAILRHEFEFDALAEASELSEDALIDVLESAERAQPIGGVSAEAGGTFAFTHALIPATLAEGMSGLRHRHLHRHVAGVIVTMHPGDAGIPSTAPSRCADQSPRSSD